MENRRGKLMIAGLACVVFLVLWVVTASWAATAQAAPMRQDEPTEAGSDECIGCHEGLRGYWENSTHAHALSDPIYREAMEAADNPQECLACHTTGYDPQTGEYQAEGVTCLACHYPVVGNHPDQYMPTDVSSRLCGTCHQDTIKQWEDSNHGQQGMTCNQCHNPHTNEIKAGNSQELCQSCHREESQHYVYTGHAAKGLLCTDCHLRVRDSSHEGGDHGQRQHTFAVDLDTCNECHASEMHAESGQAMGINLESEVACYPAPIAEEIAMTTTAAKESAPPVAAAPAAPSPLVYILPAGFGVVFGALVAPWIDRLAQQRKKGDR